MVRLVCQNARPSVRPGSIKGVAYQPPRLIEALIFGSITTSGHLVRMHKVARGVRFVWLVSSAKFLCCADDLPEWAGAGRG